MPFLEYLFPKDREIRTPESKLNHDDKGIPQKQANSFASASLPAKVSDDLAAELADQAKKAFIAMDGRHYSVFDFRIMKDEKTGKETPYFLEACPSAGFAPCSIVVRMANKSVECGGPDLTHPRLF